MSLPGRAPCRVGLPPSRRDCQGAPGKARPRTRGTYNRPVTPHRRLVGGRGRGGRVVVIRRHCNSIEIG